MLLLAAKNGIQGSDNNEYFYIWYLNIITEYVLLLKQDFEWRTFNRKQNLHGDCIDQYVHVNFVRICSKVLV